MYVPGNDGKFQQELVDIDGLFGPENPKLAERAMLLKGYEVIDDRVPPFMRGLQSQQHSALLSFCDSLPYPGSVEQYLYNLVKGYHHRDSQRLSETSLEIIATEIERAKLYIGLFVEHDLLPHLVEVSNSETELQLCWQMSRTNLLCLEPESHLNKFDMLLQAANDSSFARRRLGWE